MGFTRHVAASLVLSGLASAVLAASSARAARGVAGTWIAPESCATLSAPSCLAGQPCCVFGSNFDSPGDLGQWLVEKGSIFPGYGGNYPACITPSLVSVTGGDLVLGIANTPGATCANVYDGGTVTLNQSVGMVQAGRNGRLLFQHGTLEYRARFGSCWTAVVAYGQGSLQGPPAGLWNGYPGWTGLWVQPSGPELDFIETTFHTLPAVGLNRYIGSTPGQDNGATYFQETVTPASDPTLNFHTYTWAWGPSSSNWYVDGTLAYTFAGEFSQVPMWAEIYQSFYQTTSGCTATLVDYFRITCSTVTGGQCESA